MLTFNFWSCQARFKRVLVCLPILAPLTCAGTALEEKVFRAPMPHTQIANSGPTVKGHYVRFHSHLNESDILQSQLKSIKYSVQGCVQAKQKLGVRVNPPREYPQLILGAHEDTYFTPNRTITYLRQYHMQFNDADCSMSEVESYTAELESQAGSCTIDLIARVAEGQCDLAAHAAAAPMLRIAHKTPQQVQLANMAADPRTAAAAAQLQQLVGTPPTSLAKKRLLGIECEVLPGPEGSSSCRAIGGSFQSSKDLYLENRRPGIITGKAVQAALDVQINAAVFAPHAGKGFTLKP